MLVVLFVVNYHADEHLARLLESLAAATDEDPGVELRVHVLDNSCKPPAALEELRRRCNSSGLSVEVHTTGRNAGYFGVLPLAQSLVSGREDVVIFCNPDLLFDSSFFRELSELRGVAGVLAPSIVEMAAGVELNPVSSTRLSARKLALLRSVYSSDLLYAAYVFVGRAKELVLKRRSDTDVVPAPREIYVAHGSVFVFPDVDFFMTLPKYPCFLFGEELFVAEEARLRGVRTVFEPRLKARDVRHVSVSRLPRGELRRYRHESISFILERYYGRASERSD